MAALGSRIIKISNKNPPLLLRIAGVNHQQTSNFCIFQALFIHREGYAQDERKPAPAGA
jgi:hypothetical protein